MMKRLGLFFKSNQKLIFSGLLSGLLIGTSYIPFPPWALLFCYVPLWISVVENKESFQKSFFRGWLTQFLLSVIGFHWVAYVSYVYGYLPWPLAGIALLLFSAFIHLYIPLATGLAQSLRNRLSLSPITTFLLLATLTSLGEMLSPRLFPWNLGYPLYWMKSPIAQNADVIGFLGLSYLVLIINAVLAWALLSRKKSLLLSTFVVVASFLASLHWLGLNKQKSWAHTDQSLKVLQVQANIGNLDKLMAERGEGSQEYIVEQYFSLTRKALQEFGKVDLIVWPETAFPEFLNPEESAREYAQKFKQFVKELATPVLTGAYSREYLENKAHDYNGLYLFDENAQEKGRYHKTHLLAFGEYTPFSNLIPWLAKISPAGEGWSKGNGPKVIPFRNAHIGPQICYESLYPEFSTALAQKGAQWFVNLTNDSWFGSTSEPFQNMSMTLARAIENRRPVIRSTNTGVTTASLADGSTLNASTLYQQWYGVFDIRYRKTSELTFYTQYHSVLPFLILLIALLAIGIDRIYFRKSK